MLFLYCFQLNILYVKKDEVLHSIHMTVFQSSVLLSLCELLVPFVDMGLKNVVPEQRLFVALRW